MKKTLLTLMILAGVLAPASWGSTLTIIDINGGSSTQNVYNNSINSASFLGDVSSSQSINSGFKTVTGEETSISLSVSSTSEKRWNNATTTAPNLEFTDKLGASYTLPSDDAKSFYSTINTSFETGMTFTLGGFSSGTTLSQLSFGVGQGNWGNNAVSLKVSLTGVSFDTTGTDWVYSEVNNTYTYTVGSSANTLTNLDIKNLTITDPNAVNIKLFGEISGGGWQNLQGGLSYIAFETIPEPSTATLSVLGLTSLLLRRRRKA